MGDATKVVLALGIVGGAIYLATRKPSAPAVTEKTDDASSSICGKVGTAGGAKAGAACELVGAGLKVVKELLPESCAERGGHVGFWNKQHGFTGVCASKNPVAKYVTSVKRGGPAAQTGFVRAVCCKADGSGNAACNDRRRLTWNRLCAQCKGPWAGLRGNVGPYDHRSHVEPLCA